MQKKNVNAALAFLYSFNPSGAERRPCSGNGYNYRKQTWKLKECGIKFPSEWGPTG
jgi:hypothetical protein